MVSEALTRHAPRISEYVSAFEARLANVTLCAKSSTPSCSSQWLRFEDAWRKNESNAMLSRLRRHASEYDEFLPEANRTTMNSPKRQKKTIFSYFAPLYNCGNAAMRSAATGADGGKWLCGEVVRPCRVLSVGSNYDDSFEQAMHNMSGCRSYTVDPTLGRHSRPEVRAFEKKLRDRSGSILNATVGVGYGHLRDRHTAKHQLLPVARLLAGSGGFFATRPGRDREAALPSAAGPHTYPMSIAKIDGEGAEVDGGFLGDEGLWRLCMDGTLSVDQVTAELHARQSARFGGLRSVNAIFEGAALCGMVLHRQEINYYGCHFGGCVEYAWVSLAQLRRTLGLA